MQKNNQQMWEQMKQHWDDWGHPLRPDRFDVEQYYKLAASPVLPVLLLGDTPELRHLATHVADRQSGIDWFNLPFEKGSFYSIIGDGVITQAGLGLIDAVLPYLRKGCAFTTRVFLYNDSVVETENFNVSKFQNLGKTDIPVREIYELKGEHPTTVDYKDSDAIYHFPKLEDLPPYDLLFCPPYPYGSYFPFVQWRRK